MEKIDSTYYINQADYPSIKFKNNATLQSIGCVVCAYAMLACYKLGNADKAGVIQEIIDNYTNASGGFTNPSSMTIKGHAFTVMDIPDVASATRHEMPVVIRLNNAHNVVVRDHIKTADNYSDYKFLNPGARANTTLDQPLATHSTPCTYKRTLV